MCCGCAVLITQHRFSGSQLSAVGRFFFFLNSVGVVLYLLLWDILLLGLLWLRDSASVYVVLSMCLEVPRFVALFSSSKLRVQYTCLQ